jgi:hypothetical protein
MTRKETAYLVGELSLVGSWTVLSYIVASKHWEIIAAASLIPAGVFAVVACKNLINYFRRPGGDESDSDDDAGHDDSLPPQEPSSHCIPAANYDTQSVETVLALARQKSLPPVESYVL